RRAFSQMKNDVVPHVPRQRAAIANGEHGTCTRRGMLTINYQSSLFEMHMRRPQLGSVHLANGGPVGPIVSAWFDEKCIRAPNIGSMSKSLLVPVEFRPLLVLA